MAKGLPPHLQKWQSHVMSVRSANPGMKFKEVLKKAKSSYQRGSGLSLAGRKRFGGSGLTIPGQKLGGGAIAKKIGKALKKLGQNETVKKLGANVKKELKRAGNMAKDQIRADMMKAVETGRVDHMNYGKQLKDKANAIKADAASGNYSALTGTATRLMDGMGRRRRRRGCGC